MTWITIWELPDGWQILREITSLLDLPTLAKDLEVEKGAKVTLVRVWGVANYENLLCQD